MMSVKGTCLSKGLRPETVKERRSNRLSKGLRPEMVRQRTRSLPKCGYTKKQMNKEMKGCGVSTEAMMSDSEVHIVDHSDIPDD